MNDMDGGGTRTLWLLRHAKAAHPGGMRDHDRPLAGRGRGDAEVAGATIGRVDLVLCSSAVRTRETWECAEVGGASAASVEYTDDIYEAGAPDILAAIRAVPEQVRTLLVVGHAPGLPSVAAELAARPEAGDDAREAYDLLERHFPTCGLARLAVTGDWVDLSWRGARLLSFEAPRKKD